MLFFEDDPKNANSTVVRPDSRAVSYCADGGPRSALAVDRLRDITRCYLQSHGFQGLCPSGAGESGGAGMKVREPATRRADSTSLFLLARTPTWFPIVAGVWPDCCRFDNGIVVSIPHLCNSSYSVQKQVFIFCLLNIIYLDLLLEIRFPRIVNRQRKNTFTSGVDSKKRCNKQ